MLDCGERISSMPKQRNGLSKKMMATAGLSACTFWTLSTKYVTIFFFGLVD